MWKGKGQNCNRLLILAVMQPRIVYVLTCAWGRLWRTIAWLKSYEHLIHYCNYETKKVLSESYEFYSQQHADRIQNEESAKVNVKWEMEGKGFQKETNKPIANSLFHSIWFHIPWWRRWADGAPARRVGCCAAALSPWWPHWPGMELLREDHANKQRANHLCTHMHTASHKSDTSSPLPTLQRPSPADEYSQGCF